jgi:hypothetical protein
MKMERFPVLTDPLTPAHFAQAWGKGHEGTDVFAPAGAELVAVAAGVVRQDTTDRGGHCVYLTEPDGTRYYYAHLDAFSHPLMPGVTRTVEAGESLGYVGTSGNAKGKAPHLHFEIRPKGGDKVDPFPFLQRLSRLEEQRVVQAYGQPRPAAKPSRPKARPKAPRVVPRAPSVAREPAWGMVLVFLFFAFGKGRF